MDHFRDIVARHRPKAAAQAFMRVRTLPGEQAQVDWGSFGRIKFGAAERKLYAFVMVLSWSRQFFLRFYVNQATGNFLRGHVDAFSFFGGIPREILYDNLKSVVTERAGKAVRFSDDILELASHYRFKPAPVGVGQPEQKGRVERAIRYVRSSFFEARTWSDLDDLNEQARSWCLGTAAERRWVQNERLLVKEAFAQEKEKLLSLPDSDFPVFDRKLVIPGKTPYIRFDGNDYSIPPEYVKHRLEVVATLKTVKIMSGSQEVAAHERSFDKGGQIEHKGHLDALAETKKAGKKHRAMDKLQVAVPATTEFLIRAADRGHNLGRLTQELVRLLGDYGARDFETAVLEALQADTVHASAVQQVLDRLRSQRGQKRNVPLRFEPGSPAEDLVLRPNSLDDYDKVFQTGKGEEE